MEALSFPIKHPAYQQLRQQGRWLHLMAAGLILVHAFSHLRQTDPSLVYLACLFLLALDLVILVMAGRSLLVEQPRINLFFRFTEILFFLIIAVEYFLKANYTAGGVHTVAALGFSYLYYCERKLAEPEVIKILHTGIEIPGIPEEKFLLWTNINQLNTSYSTLNIITSSSENQTIELEKNLSPSEKEQVEAFGRYYLKG